MHVIKQLASSVLVDDDERAVRRINQTPMPVVLVDADLFAEIAQLVLGVRVVCHKVGWYVDGYLQVYKRTGYILHLFEREGGTV